MTASDDIDIAPGLPEIMTPRELAAWLRRPLQSLANDRYRRCGIPYVRTGRHVRYLKADVVAYLTATRNSTDPRLKPPNPPPTPKPKAAKGIETATRKPKPGQLVAQGRQGRRSKA